MWGQSLVELFHRGGFAMWPLLALSVLALAIALERLLVMAWLHQGYRGFRDRLAELVRRGDLRGARTLVEGRRAPLARVSAAYLTHLDATDALRDEIVGRVASESLVQVERRLPWLATIGHLAPMLGLLGTVTGLISAFHQIELRAGQVQPADLASGIWEALLTTVFGLVIALPTLAVYHFLDQRAGALAQEMQWIVSYLNEWFGKSPAPKAAASPAPAHRGAAAVTQETEHYGVPVAQ